MTHHISPYLALNFCANILELKNLSKPKSASGSSEEKCENDFRANNLGEEAADAMIAIVSEATRKGGAISETTKEKPKINDISKEAANTMINIANNAASSAILDKSIQKETVIKCIGEKATAAVGGKEAVNALIDIATGAATEAARNEKTPIKDDKLNTVDKKAIKDEAAHLMNAMASNASDDASEAASNAKKEASEALSNVNCSSASCGSECKETKDVSDAAKETSIKADKAAKAASEAASATEFVERTVKDAANDPDLK